MPLRRAVNLQKNLFAYNEFYMLKNTTAPAARRFSSASREAFS